MPVETVAIVGGGFSGAMAAINLARFGGPIATVIERAGVFGPGVAFGGRDRGQLLNVRAANMSAYHDDPDHFQEWLAARNLPDDGFARRTEYGQYLADEIAAASASSPGRIERIAEEAISVERTGEGWRIACDGGTVLEATVLVLASGLAAPATPSAINTGSLPAGCWIADPWREDFLASRDPDLPVLLIGTGLTMIDVALALSDLPDPPPIHALSRRGLLPRPHETGPQPARLVETPNLSIARLIGSTRKAAEEIGWRAAIDRLRPHTQTIWQRFSAKDRRRFMRHLRPFWDVHRHRMAPELAERVEDLVRDRKLTIHLGRLEGASDENSAVRATWVPRGSDEPVSLVCDRIVNCTGPAPLGPESAGPLLSQLIDDGVIVADPMGLGLEVDVESRTLDRSGRPNEDVYALGALTRGRFWEISAVPDIRVQAWSVARKLANAHWVGGEGL